MASRRRVNFSPPEERHHPVKGNSLLPPRLRVTRDQMVSYSSEKLSITNNQVVSSRSKFLDITDGDLLNYCLRLLAGAQADPAKKAAVTDAVRRIYSLGQAVCSSKNAALKMSIEFEFEYFARAAEGLSMPERLEALSEEEIAQVRFHAQLLAPSRPSTTHSHTPW
jgi:hypothetical protein